MKYSRKIKIKEHLKFAEFFIAWDKLEIINILCRFPVNHVITKLAIRIDSIFDGLKNELDKSIQDHKYLIEELEKEGFDIHDFYHGTEINKDMIIARIIEIIEKEEKIEKRKEEKEMLIPPKNSDYSDDIF